MDLKKLNEEYNKFYKGQPEEKDASGNVIKQARPPMKEALEKRIQQLRKELEKAKDDKKFYEIAKKDPTKRNGLTETEIDAEIEKANKDIKKIEEQAKNVSSNLSKIEDKLKLAIDEISKDPQAKEAMDYALAKKYDRKMKKNEEKKQKVESNKNVIESLSKLSSINSTISNSLQKAIKLQKEEAKLKSDIEKLDKKDPEYDRKLIDLKQKINQKHNEQRAINKTIINESKMNGVELKDEDLRESIETLSNNSTVMISKKDKNGNITKQEEEIPLSETLKRSIASCNREIKRINKMQEINTVAYADLGKVLENPKSDIAKKANGILSKSDERRAAEESLNQAKQKLQDIKDNIENNNIDIEEDYSDQIKELKEKVDKQQKKVDKQQEKANKKNNKLPVKVEDEKIGIFKRISNFIKKLYKNRNDESMKQEVEKLQDLQDELKNLETMQQYKKIYEKSEKELNDAEKQLKVVETKENISKESQKELSNDWNKNLRFDVARAALEQLETSRTKESKQHLKELKNSTPEKDDGKEKE